jgi:hypothetical protein
MEEKGQFKVMDIRTFLSKINKLLFFRSDHQIDIAAVKL